jgi:hypothetical protein
LSFTVSVVDPAATSVTFTVATPLVKVAVVGSVGAVPFGPAAAPPRTKVCAPV